MPVDIIRNPEFQDRIEEAIAEVEKKTSAELVVFLSRASGSYRDVDLVAGALFAGILYAVLILVPFPVHPWFALSLQVAAFVGGFFLCRHSRALRRILTTIRRRRAQVAEGAKLAFYDEGMGATAERNGLLLYVSLFEKEVLFLPDVGLEGKIAPAVWNAIRKDLLDAPLVTDELSRAIARVGEELRDSFPPRQRNPNEIPNRPRVRT